jgi:hypothetical protein
MTPNAATKHAVGTLGHAGGDIGDRLPWALETAHWGGLGHRDVKVAAAKSSSPDPALVTACSGISVGKLDTGKEVG